MRDQGKIFGRGISFPPRIGPTGQWEWSEGSRNVEESIQVILMTELTERLFLPDFGAGLRTFLFEPNIPSTHRLIEETTLRALATWEPRISVDEISVLPEQGNPEAATVTIKYKLVATGQPGSVNVSLQLNG